MLHHLDPVHLVDLMRIKFPTNSILIFIGGIYDGSKAGTMERVSFGAMEKNGLITYAVYGLDVVTRRFRELSTFTLFPPSRQAGNPLYRFRNERFKALVSCCGNPAEVILGCFPYIPG